MSQIDTDSIRSDYRLSDIVSKFIGKLTRDGREFKACCPFHNERSPSFTINDEKEFYHCFGCGAHGDVIDFVQNYQGVSFREAVAIITGETPAPEGKRAQRASKAVDYYAGLKPLPTPKVAIWEAGERTPQIFNPKRADDEKGRFTRYKPSMVFPYTDATGTLIGYVLRVDFGDGAKITPTVRYATLPDGTKGWTHWHFDEPRPLYGLDKLAKNPDGQVFICEGEKAADACGRLLGVTAVTWPGGTNAVGKADWSVLKGRKVVIWPDADDVGEKAAQEIAAALHGLAAEVKLINAMQEPTRDKGWDAADAEAAGMTRAEVLAWGKERIAIWKPSPKQNASESSTDTAQTTASGTATANHASSHKNSSDGHITDNAPIPDDYINHIIDDEPEIRDDQWQPFMILGYNKGTYYYMPRGTQQLTELSASAHTKSNLMQLAPLEYWESQYPKKGGFDLEMATNALLQRSAQVGIFIPERVRGRGAWMDGGKAVVHLGPVVQIDGELRRPSDVKTNYIYEAAPPLSLEPDRPATNAEANRLVQICQRLTWEKQTSAQLLAGWCVIAPVCGALDWRSHIWVTGPASAGKSTVMKRIIGQVVGPVALYVEGSTTEAGLRHSLNHDARPVIFDEAESEDRSQAAAMQKVLSLARIGSSGGEVVKGGQDGQARTYSVRSCFCFSSINTAVSHHADETRISKLVLRRNEAADRETHYTELMRDISEWLTPDYAAKMFARTVANLSTLLANARTFTDAADAVLRNRRAADQIGPMIAGLYLCFNTKKIGFDDAVEWIRKHHWDDYVSLDGANDEHKLLTVIMTKRVRVSPDGTPARDVTLGEIILHVAGAANIHGYDTREASRELGRNGIKYKEDGAFIIANKAPALSAILSDTPWSKDWVRPLRSLPGAEPADTEYFTAGLTQKGTKIPLALLQEEKLADPAQTEFDIPF